MHCNNCIQDLAAVLARVMLKGVNQQPAGSSILLNLHQRGTARFRQSRFLRQLGVMKSKMQISSYKT